MEDTVYFSATREFDIFCTNIIIYIFNKHKMS